MHRLVSLSLFAALAWTALDAAPAAAGPEVRDHRTQPAPAPAPEPRVRDHRTETQPSPEPTRRYRRRPGPKVMMPLKIDIGATGANTDNGFLSGIEARIGIHWASLSPKPTNLDIGFGLFGAVLPGPDNDTPADENDDDVVYGGAYLEVAHTLSQGKYWRTWAGGRGEYLGASALGEDHTGFGVAGRVSAELYISGVGIEPRGLFVGSYAIGVYAEAAGRDLGDNVNPIQVSAGLTFRTPLVFAP